MQIKHRYTGAVLYENAEIDNLRELVAEAVRNGVSLKDADLRRANLIGADLYGADLRGADLYGANLRGAYLRRADLSRTNLRGADLSHTDLSHTDLSGTDLRGANLRGANLSDADLPHPIYQFYLGEHHAVAQPTELRIGCEVHSWEHWLSNYEEIGKDTGMSETDIKRYKVMIVAMHKAIHMVSTD